MPNPPCLNTCQQTELGCGIRERIQALCVVNKPAGFTRLYASLILSSVLLICVFYGAQVHILSLFNGDPTVGFPEDTPNSQAHILFSRITHRLRAQKTQRKTNFSANACMRSITKIRNLVKVLPSHTRPHMIMWRHLVEVGTEPYLWLEDGDTVDRRILSQREHRDLDLKLG